MAAFIAKQMVGNQLSAVKGKFSKFVHLAFKIFKQFKNK